MSLDKIVVKGANEHNLKNIDVTIPRDKLVVITGLSGSGKSSLAFDTIYAEGQRSHFLHMQECLSVKWKSLMYNLLRDFHHQFLLTKKQLPRTQGQQLVLLLKFMITCDYFMQE